VDKLSALIEACFVVFGGDTGSGDVNASAPSVCGRLEGEEDIGILWILMHYRRLMVIQL